MSDAAIIIAKLKQIRRRQGLIFFLGNLSVAAGAVSVCALLGRFLKVPLSVLLIIGGSLLIWAFTASILRSPSIRDAAKLADRVLGLRQRLETAQECIPPHEEIEDLLLQDTAPRIASVKPAAIVPLQISRSARAALLAGIIAATGLGIFRILESWNRDGAGNTVDTARQTAVSPSRSQKTFPKAPAGSQAKPSGQMTASAAGDSNSQATVPRAGRDMARELRNVAQKQGSSVPPLTPAAGRSAAVEQPKALAPTASPKAERKPGLESDSRVPEPAAAARQGGSSLREGGKGNESALQASAAANVRKSRNDSSMGQSRATGSGAEKESGRLLSSAKTGSAFRNSNHAGSDAASRIRDSRNFRAAWTSAERALEKERFPPGLKKYVADYFEAIHPQ